MALELYRRKRNFKTTPEPEGRVVERASGGRMFVVQKHRASHLHYDFRLELDGVLLSWAVPKGPSLDPADKRLAMHVEDHPIEYGGFEGVIPPNQYGSGTVLLWDRGTWIPREDPRQGYRKGRLKFTLQGEKLAGGWTLVRTRGSKYGDSDKTWLLIKETDEFARHGVDAQIVDDRPESVLSGRDLEAIAADPDRTWDSKKSVEENVRTGAVKREPRKDLRKLEGARKAALPATLSPQLATLVDHAPQGDAWVHEIKYDGYRMLCRIEAGECRVMSRNGKDWTVQFPALAREAARLPVDSAWIDGEVVVQDGQGRTSFQALQNALSDGGRTPLVYYAFDVPYLDGMDLRNVPLRERKRLLRGILPDAAGPIRYSDHMEGEGETFFREACRRGLEGIVSKRGDSSYQATRSRDWQKVKCGQRQEFVIGGYTDPRGSRSGFGALLLGVYDGGGDLRYVGKVGTGFSEEILESLGARLAKLAQDKPAFANPPTGAEGRRAHWVKPVLVGEVTFTEWTNAGTLRHPSFEALRKDKNAGDVVRERASAEAESADIRSVADPPVRGAVGRTTPVQGKTQNSPTIATGSASHARLPRRAVRDDPNAVAGITITNPDRVLYPEAGHTKGDVARYYETVGEWILPHLAHRPLTLVRCPTGWGERGKKCFYQKHRRVGIPDVVEPIEVPETNGTGTYMMANSVSAIVALVQMGVLEFHPWGSREGSLDRADRIVLDFDPDEGLDWKSMVDAVKVGRALLDNLGLASFLRTTGGKGLHLVVPVAATRTWTEIKGFTKSIADLLVRTFPDRFTATMTLAKRTEKIFVDYLRNAEGATAIAPYSLRAKANAPVSMPIDWTDLRSDLRFEHFNIENVPTRLARRKHDPWTDFFTVEQEVTPAMMARVGYRPR